MAGGDIGFGQNGLQPPPSSMLATHFAHGRDQPRISRADFTQLLQESLGTDEHGESNLGKDDGVNLKLLFAIVQIGIEPVISKSSDPFQSRIDPGRLESDLEQSLEVICLIIRCNPEIAFKDDLQKDVLRDFNAPVFVWLIAIAIALDGKQHMTKVRKYCRELVSVLLSTDDRCSCGSCGSILVLLQETLSVMTRVAQKYHRTNSHSGENGKDVENAELSTASLYCRKTLLRTGLEKSQEYAAGAHFVAECLLDRPLPRTIALQTKKQIGLLNRLFEGGSTEKLPAQLEAVQTRFADIGITVQTLVARPDTHEAEADFPDRDRPRKRQRLHDETRSDAADPVVAISRNMTLKLTGTAVTDLDSLSNTYSTHFRRLSEDDQCKALKAIGESVCHFADPLSSSRCKICDSDGSHLNHRGSVTQVQQLLDTLEAVQTHIEKANSTKLYALDTYRRVLNHVPPTNRLRIADSVVGRFTLRMLRSPNRDIRVRTTCVLKSFIQNVDDTLSPVGHNNKVAILDYLQSLGKSEKAVALESVVLGLATVAQVVDDEERNIILLRLIEYLGHPNSYVASLVASELLQLAQALHMNLQALLRPYWKTIGAVVAKHITSRPVIAQTLCEMLGMRVNGLMELIEESALAHLVVHGQSESIQRLMSLNDSPATPFDVCSKRTNLPYILAALLAQGHKDHEEEVTRSLVHISPTFGEQNLNFWLNINPNKIACELLKTIKDAGPSRESKILQGLQLLAQLLYRKSNNGGGRSRGDAIPAFLEAHAWGIVTEFTRELDNNLTREIIVDRRRCLFGLGQITRLGKGRISVVVPQICACLRSALADKDLCNAAYSAWTIVVTSVGEEVVADILQQTFAITLAYWKLLKYEVRLSAGKVFKYLFKKHQKVIKETASFLPSLGGLPLLQDSAEQLETWKEHQDELSLLNNHIPRLRDETMVVAQLALSTLVDILRVKSDYISQALLQEQPDPIFAELIRATLDCAVKYPHNEDIVLNASQCLGCLGKVDSRRIEAVREKQTLTVLSNFAIASETWAFLLFFMDQIVVKEYVSASNLRAKTLLGWALQELLKICSIRTDTISRVAAGPLSGKQKLWFDLPEETRLVLTPFITSEFVPPKHAPPEPCPHPVFRAGITYEKWLTEFVLDLLGKGLGLNVDHVFTACWKIVYFAPGTVISAFLMPYAALNVLLSGCEEDKQQLQLEVLHVLKTSYDTEDPSSQGTIRQSSQAIFDMIDYLSRWLQEKRRWYSSAQSRADRGIRDPALDTAGPQIEAVEKLLKAIPPEVITQRSIDCRSYARALLHWDEYIHLKKEPTDDDYHRLQKIYAQIEEPDGIEGISSCMQVLSADSQIMEHKTAGRWQAVQNWYEMQLTEAPANMDVQVNLLHALREAGQHDAILHHLGGTIGDLPATMDRKLLPFATEAAWAMSRFDILNDLLSKVKESDFVSQLGRCVLTMRNSVAIDQLQIDGLYLTAASEMGNHSTTSIAGASEFLLEVHLSEDLRLLNAASTDNKDKTVEILRRRLDILGTDLSAKHYILGVQRAIMSSRLAIFSEEDIANSWLLTAKLARQARSLDQAYDAVLRVESLGHSSVVIEQAKLMWLDGRPRKAIKTLENAIHSGVFNSHSYIAEQDSMLSRPANQEQNNMIAKAYVLLGKWLDEAGQTQSDMIIETFRQSTKQNNTLESGWYHLGRHYNRILESEKAKPPGKQSQPYLIGEAAKTVITNFLKALTAGNKYLFQTLPKLLTLWLDLASNPELEQDARRGGPDFYKSIMIQRKKTINELNANVKKYFGRLQAVAMYTILPQLVARICIGNQQVYEILQLAIIRVVHAFPQQALWTLMAVSKSVDKVRASRGVQVISKVVDWQKNKTSAPMSSTELRQTITAAQRLTDELLRVADYAIEGKVSKVSLARDLGFNHKLAPSKLVVPVETCLIPSIPLKWGVNTLKTFRPFSKDAVTISAFGDEASVLASLQKPRKMTIRGSDGHQYAILAKPKDDLRKDQRLMEFDTMINRFLKRDVEASKRRLYIRTYAVIPLNEECGVIEWVNSLKTMRDVLLKLYRERNVVIDYGKLRQTLDDICSKSTDKSKDFTERVLPLFPPVLRYWFVEVFPDPDSWLSARIRYTRSTAVMSMVGHILGLGDRHGENILFEEDNGGVMHVDFNCLFDKGLTFDKPEMVPFRLTHNMVDAFGTFGIEGPFRHCCEITMQLLRNHEDGLMTVLETFLHDPTTDFMTAGKRRKTRDVDGLVPDTAEKMLEGVKAKVRGMLHGESVPLGVGGYVEQKIKDASDRTNLAKMYIGWCAFL